MFSAESLKILLDTKGINYRYNGVDQAFDKCQPIDDCSDSSIVWTKNPRLDFIDCPASVVVAPDKSQFDSAKKAVFYVENPRLVYSRVVKHYFVEAVTEAKVEGIIDDSVEVPHCLSLGYGSSIGPDCVIGSGVVIAENVTVHANTVIGDNVYIQAGVVIGSSGYGFVKDEAGLWEHFSHVGRVVLEECVEIGANSCIDRATLGETLIGANTKISNLCQVAHNVVIGRRCLIAGKAQIGGGALVGDDAYIGPSAIISNKIKIGREADVKIGSVVVQDVLDGESVSGNFAVPHRKNLKDFRQRLRKP